MKAVICKQFGPVSDLVVEEIAEPVAGPGEILVAVEAAGVNFPDGLTVRGEYQVKPPLPFIPGSEAAGTILSVGPGVDGFAPGQRVIALCVLGGFAEKVVVRQDQAILIGPSISAQTACGFTLAYGTALHALQDKAMLQSGETLLVLGAAGGVGLAAVEIGKAMGAKVIAAASTSEKLELAASHGADILVNYAQDDLKATLREIAPKGVDVVLDPVGGELTEAAVRNLAWGGRHLVVGFTQGQIPRLPVNLLLLKSGSAMGVFWGQFTQREPQQHRANLDRLIAWLEGGQLRPHIGGCYPISQAADAIAQIMERQAIGKIVLSIAD